MLIRFRDLIFLLIVVYPFYYFVPQISEGLSHFFEIIYFSFIDFLIVLYLSFYITKLKGAGLYFLLTLLIWSFQFSSFADIRPYFFILTLFLLSLYAAQIQEGYNPLILRIYPVVFIILSLISLFLPWAYIDDGTRFKGFSLSPTHYSVYALCGVVLALRFIKNKVIKITCVVIITFFVYKSETRLALAVLALIFAFYYFDKITLFFRKIISVSIIALFSLSYIVYSLITKYTDVFSLRYSGGDDKSYEARTIIQGHVLDEWQRSSFAQYLFGHGAESARNLLIDIYGFDIMPHNDFLKLLYDFGFIGFAIFIIAVSKYGKNGLLSLSLLAIYISAFYHNMAYSLFVIAMMIILNSMNKPNSLISSHK
ncbi:O-antigen ligase family protein [Scandinavium goeteborgense]|uniref:O-antigen ligase-like membrane protein n=1 Tax=Scandinavium goeteborgense TaxID=1851514 RepID=A0A4R6ED19_SCAGO|nr:O-antigen ligase family protein [Scandinavium goeteborgense]TDN55624.1 O-antigen ligase-like membrane protein [Scandinavium goeteborgense]